MSPSPSSWHLLPPDLIEHQIGQVDLLMAMYPTEEELEIGSDSSELLETLRTFTQERSAPPEFGRLPATSLILTLTLAVPTPEQPSSNDRSRSLQLDINVPFSWEGNEAPDEAPRIRVRIRQPSWLSRASTAQLNSQTPEDDDDLFNKIQSIQDAVVQHLEEAKLAEEAKKLSDSVTGGGGDSNAPLVRVWFYFPSISTRSKRDDFIINAPHYRLTGFLYAGKPGLLCLEGTSQNIDDYMKFIKTESWGDIPAHHKKVSERHREKDIQTRVFGDMEEITDSVGERRGQRQNRGDMQAVEGWLVERGLGDAFTKVLM